MKKLITLLFLFCFSFIWAQNLQIMTHEWVLTDLKVDGETIEIPENEELGELWMKIYEEPEGFFWFEAQSCDTYLGFLNWVNESAFSFFDFGGGYSCELEENEYFDAKYAEFYGYGGMSGEPLNYIINEKPDGSFTLTVTNQFGDTAIYNSRTMNTVENELNRVQISPNPFSDKIIFSGVNSSEVFVSVADLNGRLIINPIRINSNQPEIDLSKLSRGIYLIMLSDSNQKVIHKQKMIKR